MKTNGFVTYGWVPGAVRRWALARHNLAAVFFVCLFVVQSCDSSSIEYADATGGESLERVVVIADYQAVLDLFKEMDYTDKTWAEGRLEIPRIYLSSVPPQWGKSVSKAIDTKLKKRLFFRAIGPMVLRSNELIRQDRKRLLSLRDSDKLSDKDVQWVQDLAEKYRIKTKVEKPQQLIFPLLKRVDIIPASLILAQAAEESGWGTSRFAFSGNALFGQWTWGDKGITPESQRDGMGDYKIAAFDAPLQSVQAHALNLNTHSAYKKFRELRAKSRSEGKLLSGFDAAATLDKYSERGNGYVKSLQKIISYNNIKNADKAYLGSMEAIVLVPADQVNGD